MLFLKKTFTFFFLTKCDQKTTLENAKITKLIFRILRFESFAYNQILNKAHRVEINEDNECVDDIRNDRENYFRRCHGAGVINKEGNRVYYFGYKEIKEANEGDNGERECRGIFEIKRSSFRYQTLAAFLSSALIDHDVHYNKNDRADAIGNSRLGKRKQKTEGKGLNAVKSVYDKNKVKAGDKENYSRK